MQFHHVVRVLFIASFVAAFVGAPRAARADGAFTGAPPGKLEWKTGTWDRFTPAEGALTAVVLA